MTPDSFLNADKFFQEEWFHEHVAEQTRTLDGVFDLIKWKRPTNNNYLMIFIQMPGYLLVTGDVGDAIYASGLSTFKEWANCDLGYFAGKCVASENGRQYLEWDGDILKTRVKEALEQLSDYKWEDLEAAGGSSAMYHEQEWLIWLIEHGDNFFGPDRYCWPTDGKVISMRCRGHLTGLKMAVEQLNL